MFKSKLQELCQNKKWALPQYCCMRDGADHNPQFKASVVVNNINFDSPPLCKSSKEAHNEAAKFAFLHFISEDSGLTKIDASLQDKSTSEIKQDGSLPTIEDKGLTKTEEACQRLQDHLNTSEIKQGCFVTEDSHYQCKTKLQMYAKRKNLGVPVYHNKRMSSAQDLYFEATVTVAGELFNSPGAYKTAEEAEESVAQFALMKLITVALEKSNTSSYKSFLQELAQQEEICLPEYKTIRFGEPHNLTFFSSVEIEGEVFHGDGAKSKKQAEENAAKVAYIDLIKCKSVYAGNPSTVSSSLEGEIVKTEPIMESLSISIGQGKFRDEEEIVYSKHTSPQSKGAEKVNASSLSLSVQELSVNEKSPSSVEPLCHLPRKAMPSSAAMTPSKSSSVSNANSSARRTAETKSYLLSNRFRVYKSIPDGVLPTGTIVLPIAEDKWAVVSLEFLNEKCR
ncbi:double-stranded RNA-binding protein 1-like isoform X2 [Solanum dulcamara]|uniref:double-stranded RNA-binding protein 1-like isoform X2 n=1 Tax=Solanum dulcamara TaxID=45834 RepID=UPI0024865050|nr:double-stranded RNA-binding protein 1-like isoform X2 [Solanum dulcamara]